MAARRKVVRRGEHIQATLDDLPLASHDPSPFEQASRRERVERLGAALAPLGERCREIFRLKLEGFSFSEIQKRMDGATLNTVYTWDFPCRKHLLEKIG